MNSSSSDTPTRTGFRPNGLIILAILVGLGFSMVWLYRYMEPRLAAQLQAQVAAAPRTPEGRVEKWLIFGHPQIDTCIRLLRMSGEQPWIVSHLVASADGPPEVYGMDVTKIEKDYLVQVGTRMEVWLPKPGLLGQVELIGRNADAVPVFQAQDRKPDVEARVRDMIEWRLRDVLERLKSDIPEVEVAFLFGPVPRSEASSDE